MGFSLGRKKKVRPFQNVFSNIAFLFFFFPSLPNIINQKNVRQDKKKRGYKSRPV